MSMVILGHKNPHFCSKGDHKHERPYPEWDFDFWSMFTKGFCCHQNHKNKHIFTAGSVSVHKSLGSYSAERAFKPWLMAIVGFRKADYLRKHYAKRGNMQVELNETTLKGQGVTNSDHAGELKDIEAHLN